MSTTHHVYINSWHVREANNNYVGVKERVVTENDDGTTDVKDNIRFIRDPLRPFWVTKPEYRIHEYKKEYEDIDKCDKYICHDSELEEKIASALGKYGRHHRLPILSRSPYLYGADINTESLVKQKYLSQNKDYTVPFTKGGFDIEVEMEGAGRINLITFIHDKEVYTAALRDYCKVYEDEKYVKEATEEDLYATAESLLKPLLDAHGFKLHIHIAETELGVIKWVFDKIHQSKTDFISVWNMNFDIPYILNRLAELKVPPEEIFCSPEIPREDWYVKYRTDNSALQHFTDRWDWLTCSSYSQFYDSMCLYARLRKVYGRDSSYSLDAISDKELKLHKLHFGKITNHHRAQRYEFPKYLAYNINDVILLMLLEEKNKDVDNMCGLADGTLLSEYSRQTSLVRNAAYQYAKERDKVIATTSDDMYTDYDRMMSKSGGTVLPLDRADICIKAINGSDGRSLVTIMVNDLDIGSSYPSAISAMNISKETYLGSIIAINDKAQGDVEVWNTGLIQPEVHALIASHYFYEMPTTEEMSKKFDEYLKTRQQS